MNYRLRVVTKDGRMRYHDDWEDLGIVDINRFSEPNCLAATRHDKVADSTQVIARVFEPKFEMAWGGAVLVSGLENLASEHPLRPDRLDGSKTLVTCQWVLEPEGV